MLSLLPLLSRLRLFGSLIIGCVLFFNNSIIVKAGTIRAINGANSTSANQVVCVSAISGATNVTATFNVTSCTVTGGNATATVNVQWYVNTSPSNTGGAAISGTLQTISVGTNPTVAFTLNALSYIPTSATGTKYYYAVISNQSRTDCGNATTYTSGVVAVTVVNAPLQGSWVSNPSAVCRDVATTFEVTGMFPTSATGYAWSYSGSGGTIGGTTNSSLVSLTLGAGATTGTLTVTATACGGSTSLVSSIVGINSPPTISSQPVSTAQSTCTNTAFTTNPAVTVSGGTYQWFSNAAQSNAGGTSIAGAISSSYTPPVNVNGTTYYYCVVTQNGCSTTSNVSGAYVVGNTPSITANPALTTASACEGGSFSTALSVSGSGLTGYQWYLSTSNANNNGNWNGATLIAGATSSTYLPPAATIPATQPLYYFCKVTGCTGGTANSNFSGAHTVNTNPVVTTASVAQTNCSPFNGSVSANVGGATAGHTFAWYSGSTATGTALTGTTTATNYTSSARAAGQYTVRVTNNTTSCFSDKTQAVADNSVYPSITTSTVSSTNCTGAGNGSVSANIGGATAGYTFNWYPGSTASGTALTASTTATNFTASGLAGGQSFTVGVSNNSTGCSSQATVNLTDAKANPVLTLATSPNTRCDTNYNGSLTGTVATDINKLITDTYTYSWSTGSTMSSPIAGEISSTLSGRAPASYTATVTNDRLGCTSTAVTGTVGNSTSGPTAAVLSSSASFPICPNSSTTVQVAITGGNAPYTFTLSDGSVVSPGYVSGTNAAVTPAAQQTLTLSSVTDAFGCPGSGLSGSVTVSWKTSTEWTAGSGSWSSGSNWSCGVPTSSLDASIPGGVVVTLPSGTSDVRALTISAGGTLTFSSGSILQVRGNIVNEGTVGYATASYVGAVATSPTLRLNGSVAQTISGAGTYNIHNLDVSNTAGVINEAVRIDLFNTLSLAANTSFDADGATGGAVLRLRSTSAFLAGNVASIPSTANLTGNVTYQRHIGQVLTSKWRYLSIPLTGFTLSGQLSEWITKSSVYYYNEPTTGAFSNGWIKMATTYNFGTLQIGRGYQSWNTPSLYEARGSLNSGTIQFPVSYSFSGSTDADGWNCVGNPYPSNIQWNNNISDWYRLNIGPVVYIPDNKANVWRTVNVDGTGNIPSGIIAAGQAFWIYASAVNPVLEIRESAKRADTTRMYRQASSRPGLSLALKYGDVEDNAFLLVSPGTTESFDSRHDAPKLEGELMGVSIVSKDNRKLVYSHVPEIQDWTPLNIWGSASGKYTFSVSQLAPSGEFPELYLVDQLTGTSRRLEQGSEVELQLTASEQQGAGRFFLTRANPDAVEESQFMNVFPNPAKDRINVQVPAVGPVAVSIIGVSGVKVAGMTLNPVEGMVFGEFDLTGLKAGIYVIEADVNGSRRVAKFMKF